MTTARQLLGGRSGKIPLAPMSVGPRKPLDRQMLPYYWHPDRIGVEHAPDDFAEKLRAIHPGLACTKFPIEQKWILWSKAPWIQHPLCPNWLLLFVWQDEEKRPLPLDNRVFYNLYRRDPSRYRSCREYFDLAVAELKEAKDRRERDLDAGATDRRKDYEQFIKPKSIGHGSKSAIHDDGTIIPSRGTRNWLRERGGVWGEKSTRDRDRRAGRG